MNVKANELLSSYETFLKNRSKDYMQYGRYLVKELTVQDAPLRLISFMGDVAGMLSPILLLDYFFLRGIHQANQ